MEKDKNVQFLCQDCENYNRCEYYYNRKEFSHICKYFHLPDNKYKNDIDRTGGEAMKKITIQAALNNLYIVKAVFKNIKSDPELINSLNVAINSLEAWDDILDELGDINMDIYTDEVREMINEKMEVLG